MPISTTTEWRTENNLRAFPFGDGCIGDYLDFIADAKFFLDSRTQKKVYLSSVAVDTPDYLLEFRYTDSNEPAISGRLPISTDDKKRLYLYDASDSASLAIITPGPRWSDTSLEKLPRGTVKSFSPSFASMDDGTSSAGVNSIRRLVIEGKDRPAKFTRDISQVIKCGQNTTASVVDIDGKVAIEIDANFKPYNADDILDCGIDGIKTINWIKPTDAGAFTKKTEDCISVIGKPPEDIKEFEYGLSTYTKRDSNGTLKTCTSYRTKSDAMGYPKCTAKRDAEGKDRIGEDGRPVCDTKADIDENAIRFSSACLPCCGCSDYQRVSNAITRLDKEFSDICSDLDQIFSSIASDYNRSVNQINDNKMPITRIRAIRVYQNTIKMAFQNTCSLEIYGEYGVTLTCSGISFSEKHTKKDAADPIYGAVAKYNQEESNTREIVTQPYGTYTGILGPISPGKYVEMVFEANGLGVDGDLRNQEILIKAESTGYFGEHHRVACKKDVYTARVEKDPSKEATSCNPSNQLKGYKVIVEDDAP